MIAHLKGNLLAVDRGRLIISCNGVGYLVSVLPADVTRYQVGETAEVYTYTYVKEDILALFGFTDLASLRTFELLISVSGIGPKTGLNIMGAGEVTEIKEAIKNGEVEFFTKVPGIGKKNAQRLIVELRNKLGGDSDDVSYLSELSKEAVEALTGLGFSKTEAGKALAGIDRKVSLEEQIKLALKYLQK